MLLLRLPHCLGDNFDMKTLLIYCAFVCFSSQVLSSTPSSSSSSSNALDPKLDLLSRASACTAADSPWQPNYAAFQAAAVGPNLGPWWGQQRTSGVRFDDALGRLAGTNNFRCGIALTAQCVAPDCTEISDHGGAPWVGQAIESCQNLNTLFQIIYDGIGWGQGDASGLTTNLADDVFKFKDPTWKEGEIINWLGMAVTMLFTFGLGAIAKAAAGAIASGTGLLAGAATSQLTMSLAPPAGTTRRIGINKLNALFYELSSNASLFLEDYANATFAGDQDANNKNIVDIISTGSYAGIDNLPQQSTVSNFYKTFLFAKAVNGYWSNSPVYVLSTSAAIDPEHDELPENATWYSNSTKRTYAFYSLQKGRSERPPGLKALNSSLFDISAPQIAESAGRAWEVAGNNYTVETAYARIQAAFASPETLGPFTDGPAWEGTFNITVCDVGKYKEWLPPYDDRFAYTNDNLPCCCGTNCNDTRAFVHSAHLHKSYDFWSACRKQLHEHPLDNGVTFDQIDYGIDTGTPFVRWWKGANKGQRAGVVIGFIAALALAILIIICVFIVLVECFD